MRERLEEWGVRETGGVGFERDWWRGVGERLEWSARETGGVGCEREWRSGCERDWRSGCERDWRNGV